MIGYAAYPNMLSLGAGVQSSCMALMASEGLIKRMPRAAFFADTGDEPQKVYEWLDWLEPQLAFPLIRCCKGPNLSDAGLIIRKSKKGLLYQKHAPPAFIKATDGEIGLMPRQCTSDFKLDVLHRAMAKWRHGGKLVQWIGISTDEAGRIKDSRVDWLYNRYPLIDLGMTRQDCLDWMKSRGYPQPPRSACKQCPYHSDDEWIDMQMNRPDEFAFAVQWEQKFAETMMQIHNFRGTPFLHRQCIPLSEVKFTPGVGKKLMVSECEGMCGV